MTSHCRAALAAAGLPATPVRMSDALRTIDRVTFLTEFLGVAQKRCTRCDAVKPLDDFYPNSPGWQGGQLNHRAWCKACFAEDGKRRRTGERRIA